MTQLPSGIYAISSAFADKTDEVTFTFKGVSYTAVVGVQAFASFEDAMAVELSAPAESFSGQLYSTPVILMPAGTYEFGRASATPLSQPVTVMGEGPASRTEGSFYHGTFTVPEGTHGCVTLQDLSLFNTRVYDNRTAGSDLGLIIRNCFFEGALTKNLIYAAPLADASCQRTLIVEDCCFDGFDSLDDEGCAFIPCATDVQLRRISFTNTKKFLGFTNYARTFMNAAEGADISISLEDCRFENCSVVHGLSIQLPDAVGSASITLSGCCFRHFAPQGEAALQLRLPHEGCSLTVRDSEFVAPEGEKAPAIMIDGPVEAVCENTSCIGFSKLSASKPARRTVAPAQIGEVVWTELDDPHEVVDGDVRYLEALYGGRYAYHGDMHCHSNSGGTSDGKTPLAQFARDLRALKMDFAAVVDHRQMRHMFLPEYDDTIFICGTEPGTNIIEEGREPRSQSMHYVMLFQYPTDLARVLDAFPEFNYTGGLEGHFSYPNFTPERLAELARFVRSLGGMFSHAHPKQLMASDNPLHFYFTDDVTIETINTADDTFGSLQNLRLWETLLKMGKRPRTVGCSDTHGAVSNRALTTVHARERKGAAFLREIREGDCTSGAIGIKMCISGVRMGGSIAYRDGLTLNIQVADWYEPAFRPNTVYAVKVYTDQGLAYASEFNGRGVQNLALAVQKRKYYRVEVTNESDGYVVGISNPIWLD